MKGVVLTDQEWTVVLDVLYEDASKDHEGSFVRPVPTYDVWKKIKAILESQ